MKQRCFRRLLGLGTFALAVAASTPSAKADYSLEVITGGYDSGPITAGSPFALGSSTATSVTVDTGVLNADLSGNSAGFQFNSLAGSDNSDTPTTVADLFQNGAVFRSSADGTGTITIIATETGFNFPAGVLKVVTGSASDTFLNFASGDSRTFTSRFTDANGSVSTITQTFAASRSSSGDTATSPFPGMDTFTLTSTTVINLGFNRTARATDQFTGTTTVTALAVPEPGSLALIALGGLSIAFARRHRRNSLPA